jgi:predicted dehydrogenase
MMTQPKIRFAAIGLNHGHIYSQVRLLLEAGAELAGFYAREAELATAFSDMFPDVRQAASVAEILEDRSIQIVTSAGIPDERGPLGVEVMKHEKDFLSDKPGFTTLAQLAEARRVQAETGRIYSIFYGERLESRASVRAAELVQAGAIGKVVQTIGMGPHRINLPSRAEWFFQKERYGGILTDIGSHQMEQFLFFTGSDQAEVVSSQVANYRFPEYPELEDFGDAQLRGNGGTGYLRVDWFTPDGLPSWGDGRLFVLGTDGYLELRKNVDPSGREGGNHLFLVDHAGMQYMDCTAVELPFGRQLLMDVINRTETALPQAHTFLAAELAIRAEAQAVRVQ